jgi:hypothetical protein
MDNTAPDRQWVTCPGCAEAFDLDHEAVARGEADGTVQCPFCNTRFIPTTTLEAPEAIPSPVAPFTEAEASEGAFLVVEDGEGNEGPTNKSRQSPYRPSARSPDLSTARIRDLSAARRALLRVRSWCVVATLVCAVAVVQLAWLIVQRVRGQGWFWEPILYAALIPVAAFWAISFARRAVAATRELRRSVQHDPDMPPDFSTLSDGSQQWKNLEGM